MKLSNLKINKDNFKSNNNLSLSKKIVAGVIAVGLVAGGVGFIIMSIIIPMFDLYGQI